MLEFTFINSVVFQEIITQHFIMLGLKSIDPR